ncbi:general stress protein [Escherichia coli]|nr:general stress protein [Escherichia coli]
MAEHRGGSGNFAEDREKASDAGRKGGQHSGGNIKNSPASCAKALPERRVVTAKAATVNFFISAPSLWL